ncbi:DNA-directed RNA polymerase subunit beta [Streptococcus dentiloxodontae]
METGGKYVLRQLLFIFIIFLLSLLFLAIGLMIGYSLLGEGNNPLDILKPSTWQSIVDKFIGN